MKKQILMAAVLAAVLSSGCQKYYYNPAPQILPAHIQKIAVRAFANHTQQYGLEDKLTLATQSEFNRDGRFQITTEEQADGVVIGDITRYILEPLSYDVNHVPTEYKLWVLVDLTFYDKVKNLSLWKEPNMSEEIRYYVASSGLPGSMTEEEAREQLWDQFSKDIRIRTFEGFGTITGASEKAVPKSSPTPDATTNPLNPTSGAPPGPGEAFPPSQKLEAPY